MKQDSSSPLPPVTLSFLLAQESLHCLQIEGDIEALTGYQTKDLLSKNPGFESIFHPDDTDVCEEIFSHLPQAEPLALTYRIIQKNGKVKILNSTYQKSLIPGKDNKTTIQITLKTPLRPQEDIVSSTAMTNFIAMLENTDDYIYFKDRNHVFTGASQTLVTITDPTERWTDLIGKTDYEVFPEKLADIYFTLEKKVFSGLLPVAQEVQPTLDVHGNKGWVDNRKYPIKDKIGSIIGLFGVARDITELKLAQDALQQEQAFSTAILDSLPGIFYLYTYPELRLVLWNKQHEEILGFNAYEMKDRHITEWQVPEHKEAVLKAIKKVMEEGQSEIEAPLMAKDGRMVPFLLTGVRVEAQGRPYFLGIGIDITKRRRAEMKQQLAASVFTHAHEGITITEADGSIVDVNDTFTRITGYSREEALGQNPRILKSGRHSQEFFTTMWQDLIEKGGWSGEIWNRHKDGGIYAVLLTISAIRDESGQTQNYVALLTNITEMKQHEQQLQRMAQYDALTGLPNRTLLADRLQQAMAQSQRRKQSLAIVYIDLDGFKGVNDNYGHDVGDELLIALSQRMHTVLREVDTLARIGGDEFVAVLSDFTQPSDYEPVLVRLLHAVAEPVKIGDTVLQVSASIGATFYPHDHSGADVLLRHADEAMYQAKQAGKNCYRLFAATQDTARDEST